MKDARYLLKCNVTTIYYFTDAFCIVGPRLCLVEHISGVYLEYLSRRTFDPQIAFI